MSVYRTSRFLSEMAARTLELAQWRIAVSIAALKRVLAKPPPPPAPSPPSPAPHIKSMFLSQAKPRRKLRKVFKPR
jgi:hypothetical protein